MGEIGERDLSEEDKKCKGEKVKETEKEEEKSEDIEYVSLKRTQRERESHIGKNRDRLKKREINIETKITCPRGQ